MKLIIGEKEIDYTDNLNTDGIIEAINGYLLEGFHFSHFIADGVDVYEQHEEYLDVHLDQLKELKVIVKTEKEFLNDVLISAEDYLKGAKVELAALPNAFFTEPTAETWTNFELFLEGAGWLGDVLAVLGNSEELTENSKVYTKLKEELEAELTKLGKTVEQQNNNEIGNIIQNGVIPLYNALEVEISKTNDSVGVRENLN